MQPAHFLSYAICHITGITACIWASHLYQNQLQYCIYFAILLSGVSAILKQAKISVLLLFFCLGCLQINSNFQINELSESLKISRLKVRSERIKTLENGLSVYGKIVYSSHETMKGKNIYLYIDTDKINTPIHENDIISIGGLYLNPVISNQAPYDFDFDKYLLKQNIQWKVFIKSAQIDSIIQERHIIKSPFQSLQSRWKIAYSEHFKDSTTLAIISALSLGDKTLVKDNIRDVFASTGAMHVLAVSGLHVGIIFIMMNFIFHLIPFQGRLKTIISTTSAVFIIWAFALLTGGSPSTIRASFMITVIIAGNILSRKSKVLNTIGFTACFLLCINPYLIFQLSFQFSFVALLSIVIFQPIIESIYLPQHKLLRYFVKLFYLSFAAQILTLPLVVYYFHQIPIYFFLSGIIAVPMAGVILVLLLCWLAGFELFGFELIPLTYTINFCTKILYQVLEFIQTLPYAVISIDHITWISMTLYYLFIGCLLKFLYEVKKHIWLILLLVLITLFSGTQSLKEHYRSQQKIWITSQIKGSYYHCLILGKTAYIHPSDNSSKWLKKLSNISSYYQIAEINNLNCSQFEKLLKLHSDQVIPLVECSNKNKIHRRTSFFRNTLKADKIIKLNP